MTNPISQKQLEANRRNAQKSTGPGTPQGQACSRRNALKHGLLAKEVVICDGDGVESQDDFDSLLADLYEELRPQGVIEETLVERVATCYWRLRRAQRYEVGIIRDSLDECDRPQDEPECATARDIQAKLDLAAQRLARQQQLAENLKTAPDLNDPTVFNASQPALNRIAADHNLPAYQPPTPPTSGDLFISSVAHGRPQDTLESRQADTQCTFLQGLERVGLAGPTLHQALRHAQNAVLQDLRTDLNRIQAELEPARRYDRLRQARRPLVGSLPAEDNLIKLVRYETMLDRQIHRALNELRRRQAARPDPIDGQRCPTACTVGGGTDKDRPEELPDQPRLPSGPCPWSADRLSAIPHGQTSDSPAVDGPRFPHNAFFQTNPFAKLGLPHKRAGAPPFAQQGVGSVSRALERLVAGGYAQRPWTE